MRFEISNLMFLQLSHLIDSLSLHHSYIILWTLLFHSNMGLSFFFVLVWFWFLWVTPGAQRFRNCPWQSCGTIWDTRIWSTIVLGWLHPRQTPYSCGIFWPWVYNSKPSNYIWNQLVFLLFCCVFFLWKL